MESCQEPQPRIDPCSIADPSDLMSRSSLDYSTPLLSARSDGPSSRSPSYKLSAELSREPLRIPAAVPFLWEQSPGRCRALHSPLEKPASTMATTPPSATDLTDHSLGNLFLQPNRDHQAGSAPASPSAAAVMPLLPPIAQPPAMERPRCSSARRSGLQNRLQASSLTTFPGDIAADALSDSVSDDFSATAGGVSVDDDSLALSGPLRPASMPSETRDFLMHRFLPAAHTIACELPQTPSRRFSPLGFSAGPPATAPLCGGSFRNYGGVACTESTIVHGPSYKNINSSLYGSPSTILTHRKEVSEGSFHSAIDELDDASTEDDEEPPLTSRSCGIFPFHIRICIHTHQTKKHPLATSKIPHHKNQTTGLKGRKVTSHSHMPKRIMDILCEDEANTCEGISMVHAEKDRKNILPLQQTPLLSSVGPCARQLYSKDSHRRESPWLHQNCSSWQSHFNINKSSAFGSCHNAPSWFCGPSSGALHCANVRALHRNCIATFAANAHGTRACSGFTYGSQHPSLTCPLQWRLYNYDLPSCNTHTSCTSTPRSYSTEASSCPSCVTLTSHQSSSQDSFGKQDIATDNYADFNAFSPTHHSEKQAHITNNAHYEQDDQETHSSSAEVSCPGTLTLPPSPLTCDRTGINYGCETQPQGQKWHADAANDMNTIKTYENFPKADEYMTPTAVHNENESNLHKVHRSSNGGICWYERQDNINNMNGGDTNACNEVHNSHDCHINCVRKTSIHEYNGAHYVCDANHNLVVHSAINNDKKGSVHGRKINIQEFTAPPPIPRSPTNSWLDRTVATAAGKGWSRSSRFSCLHDKPAIAAAAEHAVLLKKEEETSLAMASHSKWEALVKGSHLQPGHLRSSKEELCYPLQSMATSVS